MMGRLCILACGDFYPEVAAAIESEGWTDVAVAAFPPDCARPPLSWEQLRARVPEDCSDVVVFGKVCLRDLSAPPPGMPPVRLVELGECFDLVADESLVRERMAAGAYLMTPSWLKSWQHRMQAQGFDGTQAGAFFRDFAKKLVLLDTGPANGSAARLKGMAGAVDLPAERVEVGLGRVRGRLEGVVRQWRDAVSDEAKTRQQTEANYAAALDLMARLALKREEPEVVAAIKEIFTMLFAPGRLWYLPVERGAVEAADGAPEAALEEARHLNGAYAWTASGRGFLVRLSRGEQTLAVVVADELVFPEYRERYLNMALAMVDVAALAVEGARTRRSLMEAEKMASLSVLVAGVAHEINTPVGVCLAAASTLDGQVKSLSEQFAARTMRQSDLSRFLATAATESQLIVGNLERMGRLIESFRKVAVERVSRTKKTFALRALIEQAIATAGRGRLGAGLTVEIDCDPELALDSYAGDWISIVTNLYTNALRHGFRGRAAGTVRIAAHVESAELVFDFSDDGAGFDAETKKRIFDPFYTTDLQQGMGLGMHLVYNLVRQCLGGSISCESEPGKGAHFRIVTPL